MSPITETKDVNGEPVVDLAQLNKAISALAALGKQVNSISVYNIHADFDTAYYHRFSEAVMVKLGHIINQNAVVPVTYKNGRLYVYIELQNSTYEIVVPRDVRSSGYSEAPQLTFMLKWR